MANPWRGGIWRGDFLTGMAPTYGAKISASLRSSESKSALDAAADAAGKDSLDRRSAIFLVRCCAYGSS